MLTCKNLTLKNSLFTVFHNIGFTALPGSIILLTGKNGCGKTSLLKMIAGLIPTKPGQVTWNKTNITVDLDVFQQNICYIGHKNALKKELSVKENLEFWAKFKGDTTLLAPAIHYFQLDRILDTKVGFLSSGWQRKVELSKLLISNSNLWLLDEPEISLDKSGLALLQDLIQARTQDGGIVVIASHHSFKNLKHSNHINLQNFYDARMDYAS